MAHITFLLHIRSLSLLLPLLLFAQNANAAPVSGKDEPDIATISYQSEPKIRGTISLIFSCTVTLVLCVWTALHLNVEPLEFSRSKLAGPSRVVGKMIWGFTALIAPEVVLSIALHQFLVAYRYQSLLETTEETFGLKKAFYAVMGGFALEGAELGSVTLDIAILVNTATLVKIQQYPTAAIDDKSKADYLAKLLTCVQAGWILLQCLGRKLSGLPITFLELNTVLHVVNAMVMYSLWWKKPLDVGQPSII
ncbi:hypothetical protein EDC01DRAFT_624948, partial [Geopyxis carbonaria]